MDLSHVTNGDRPGGPGLLASPGVILPRHPPTPPSTNLLPIRYFLLIFHGTQLKYIWVDILTHFLYFYNANFVHLTKWFSNGGASSTSSTSTNNSSTKAAFFSISNLVNGLRQHQQQLQEEKGETSKALFSW